MSTFALEEYPMNHESQNFKEVLSRNISGYHQYCLEEPGRLRFVSQNLCRMLGVTEDDLLRSGEDPYALRVHPADRAVYSAFLQKLRRKEQTLTQRYRLVKGDGSILFVSDTMTSYRTEGILVGDSVLTDITALKRENENLRFLSETIPCGFLKYTCEKNPKVTFINDRMLQILRLPETGSQEFNNLEMYRQNIYTTIPMEDRSRFARYLERVYEQGAPLAGEITALRCDGTKAYLFGWVTKCVNEQGVEEFQSACMDITERYLQKQEQAASRYLKALTEVYDKIFEYDLSRHTVKCLYGQNSSMFRWLEHIPMQMEEATEKWIMETVYGPDRERLHTFFQDFFRGKCADPEGQPPQITYRALSSAGILKTYTGIFLKLDGAVSLYCCRTNPDVRENEALRSENDRLKNMQELVMRFTEGVVAFEVENDTV